MLTEQQFYCVLNSTMPDYKPVEKIGAGNFGSVYKCERDGIYYAIKIIPVPSRDEELQMLLARADRQEVQAYLTEKVESYRREIRLMAELKGNRNIVNIEDYKVVLAENGLSHYIVIRMELLTSLVRYTSQQALSREEILHLGIDICDALSICEKHGIIHRDIKPENIMLHNDGAYKLGDFGIAKQLSKTTTGTVAGTEGFMAPEVCRAMEYNHTADIYSLGIVLYYYLNNQKMPFVSPDNKSILAEQQAIAKRMTTYESLPLPPNADEMLGKVIVKACMFDKGRRYQSASEMRADLIRVLNGQPVEADLSTDAPLMVNMENGSKYERPADSPFSGAMIKEPPSRNSTANYTTQEILPPKKKKKKTVAILIGICAALICLAVGAWTLLNYINSRPTTYLDADGNEIQTISRNAMTKAYELGLQYYEQGSYENAIAELSKVTEKSPRYDDAQSVKSQAMAAYATKLIEQSTAYLESGNYETALGLVESGMTLMGDDANLYGQVQSILNTLKLDMINQSTEAEKAEEYGKAFSYIQIASAFLPDDLEIQAMYIRLEAMSIAADALRDAQQYLEAEDYTMSFSILEDALEKVSSTQTAVSKITLVYDKYQKDYLSDLDKLVRSAKSSLSFDQALDALATAMEIFPNSSDLQSQYRELTDLDTAHTALTKADSLARMADYAALFQTLQTALDAISSGSEMRSDVQQSYDTYKEQYLQQLTEEIGQPQTVEEYANAISLLEQAVEILPDEYQLAQQLQQYQADIPINLFDQNIIDTKWKKYDTWVALDTNDTSFLSFGLTAKDNFGDIYHNAALIGIGYGWTKNNATYIIYDCENYNRLVGTVAIAEDTKSYAGSISLVISGLVDATTENVLYDELYPSGTRPQTIDLDISKYSMVKLELVCHKQVTNTWAYLILSDFSLSK